ncbi:hypothetical protein P692DRAFT_20877498 [Suillus brevipes Sb2]|nr:hypothetical protein P692DRAFT_20877498 [Suillus brevipes Sb2]
MLPLFHPTSLNSNHYPSIPVRAWHNPTLLPALEFAYDCHAIAHAPREVIAREMIPPVGGAMRELGLLVSSGSEGLASFWRE